MADEEKQKENWGEGLSLEGRVTVFPQKPLPDLNAAGGAAFAARYRNDVSQDLLALICSRGTLPRAESVNSMRAIDCSSLLRLRDGGVVEWPAQQSHYYALVYDRPLAERYWKTLDEVHPTMNEDSLNHTFIMPLIKALLELQRMGLMHGGIRPTNIFWRDGSTTPPQLGDGLSAPAGIGQPDMFETVERAMCRPMARGPGFHVDDCYAFGVMLAMVILGQNPYRGMDDRAILNAKMEKGTFNSLIGSRRLAGGHIELLRGLLMDDSHQRWTAEDLEQWMTGRRLTPKSSDAGRRSSRVFSLGGRDYWQLRPLAAGLSQNVSEAVKVIEDGSLDKWLQRAYVDVEKAKSVDEAVSLLKEGGKSAHYQDQLVARVCIALDPQGPIHYRGISAMPSGIAPLLADAILTSNSSTLQSISEMITSQFVTFWVNMQKDAKVDLVPLAQLYERMRPVIEKPTFGNGLERAVYELNPMIPCLSPMIVKGFVLSPKRLLLALEHAASLGIPASEPMDRHIAAFLAMRDKPRAALFAAMGPGETTLRRGLALLALFGELQYRYGPDQLPKLCAWLWPSLEPGVKRYLNKPFQDKVRTQAKEAVAKGDLSLLLKRIDDPGRVHGDEQDFLSARLLYQNVKKEIAILEESLRDRQATVRDIGRPVAASIASFMAIVFIAVTLGRAVLRSLLM